MNAKITKRLAALTFLLLTAGACKSGRIREDPILRLSSAEALVEGQRLFEQGKYNRARPYLSHAFEVEPNSAGGRDALLMVADCYFKAGSQADLIQAEAKYRDFQNRFPTSPKAAYVQYQIAQSLADRIEKPQRDQTATLKAKSALEELIRLFPTSEYAEAAREKLGSVEERLAEHEFLVGHFYLRYGLPSAAVSRLEGLLKQYPGSPIEDKTLYYLAKAYDELARPEDAQATWTRLRTDFPQSPWIAKIPGAKA
ncbi:MAG: outer membrane protein assembly factor BamD [Thermoanaerobaculia bacterium]